MQVRNAIRRREKESMLESTARSQVFHIEIESLRPIIFFSNRFNQKNLVRFEDVECENYLGI